jgi:hypothetical protein
MKKLIILITLAVLMLAYLPEIQGKSQNADIKNEIKGGHHNAIVTNVDQVSQIANKNNVPYGQLKKAGGVDWVSENARFGLSQNMNIQNQIAGGHHNMIAVNGRQVAVLGALGSANNSTTTGNLSQVLNTQNQIIGGHHNVIVVGSSQLAWLNSTTN